MSPRRNGVKGDVLSYLPGTRVLAISGGRIGQLHPLRCSIPDALSEGGVCDDNYSWNPHRIENLNELTRSSRQDNASTIRKGLYPGRASHWARKNRCFRTRGKSKPVVPPKTGDEFRHGPGVLETQERFPGPGPLAHLL